MFASLLYKLSKSPFVLPVYVPFQFSTIEHFISYPCIYRWFLYVSWILLMQWFYFIQLTVASIHLGNIVITHTLRMLCLCPLFFPDIRTYIYMRETTILISLAGFFLLGLGSVLCVMVVSFDFVSFLSRSPLAGALHAVVLARFNYW